MDTVNKIHYKIGDTKTRSVTLFPTRAQVFRELKDVDLKPGVNEVTISGLSPTLDEDSVKVEGTGAAIITDIAVVQLPNRDIFEEVYSDEDEDDPENETEDEYEKEKESIQLQKARFRLTQANDRLALADEAVASAQKRLNLLDTFSRPLDDEKRPNVGQILAAYKTEREIAFHDHITGAAEQRKAQKDVDEASYEERRLCSLENKTKKKERRAKQKEQEKRRRRREEHAKEKQRIQKEREKFWPKYCYSVTITLDVNSMTPMTSRRHSVSSDVDFVKPATEKVIADDDATVTERFGCDLVLSYVTLSASWTPSYDLQLSTTNGIGTLCFDAQINNKTSETWSHCKVSLSTSDTTFSGLDSRIPTLVPWRIRLANKNAHADGVSANMISHSAAETEQQRMYLTDRKYRVSTQKPRNFMFGLNHFGGTNPFHHQNAGGDEPRVGSLFGAAPAAANNNITANQQQQAQQMQQMQQMQQRQQRQQRQAPSAFGATNATEVFGSVVPARVLNDTRSIDLFGSSAAPQGSAPAPPVMAAAKSDDSTIESDGEDSDAIDFENSTIEESGLTTSYDLPGLKTLAPRSGASKQRVARISFSGVSFSHTVVAKYRPVAYLRAKLKNNSKLTLLEGDAGLTLDGSFMGRTRIPRCSSGDMFTLSLGVDPAITVLYPKPEVRRATTGLFTKENSSVFARAIILHNTRAAAGKPAQLFVRDQVPVSEDERLRVDLVTPSGLSINGGSVATGAPGREVDRDRDWGKALAMLKKGGEISWDVKLNAGKVVKLWLEYSVSMPSSDVATECSSK